MIKKCVYNLQLSYYKGYNSIFMHRFVINRTVYWKTTCRLLKYFLDRQKSFLTLFYIFFNGRTVACLQNIFKV